MAKTVTNPSVSSLAIQPLPRKQPTPSLATSPPKAKRSKTLKKGGIPGMFPHYSESTPLFSKPSNFLLQIVFQFFTKDLMIPLTGAQIFRWMIFLTSP